ncbi:Cu-Zn family superoxide dismutase [Alkalispirillum mobile]|uniref:Superoxide dismutase [Cu-Zn] n=1 Tax=Alkalispirillum mobile TaxID=85925 RepID=A0A498BT05_9GAMM|nr:superoxide dismutase family protein [Alkalispirillum mobile]RLK46805.1 Cu-Zn family superoxide dismutase [Alkalispirillum mobile]
MIPKTKNNCWVAGAAVAACGLLTLGMAQAGGHDEELPTATAEMFDNDGESIGTAEFTQGPHGTLIRLELSGMEGPGFRAIHIHETGDCDDHDHGFMDSGGHLNPDDKKHGLMNPEGPDAGDLTNIYVQEDGTVNAELFTMLASLDGAVGGQMLDDDGAALVIHENPDDHMTQPIGGAGARIACGVIKGD